MYDHRYLDIGYALYSRLERAWRDRIASSLNQLEDWTTAIPPGIRKQVAEKVGLEELCQETIDCGTALAHTNFIDIKGILEYRNNFDDFGVVGEKREVLELIGRGYEKRNGSGHVHPQFDAFDVESLVGICQRLLLQLGEFGKELEAKLDKVRDPTAVWERAPGQSKHREVLTNLLDADYSADGGFIGRKEAIEQLDRMLSHPKWDILTVVGSGGVGKTALAHYYCERQISARDRFRAVVWTSAKTDELTDKGIRPIAGALQSYVGLLDSILSVLSDVEFESERTEDKRKLVDTELKAGGVLLVIDNLETIAHETSILEFLRDIPPNNKVLITGRVGLGELEQIFELGEMATSDAVRLARVFAKEKGITDVARMKDSQLKQLVERMSLYPLVIKWVIGQLARGYDINQVLESIAKPSGDVAQFTFEKMVKEYVSEDARRVLYALALSDDAMSSELISHAADLTPDAVAVALSELKLASFVLVAHEVLGEKHSFETRYRILPISRQYLLWKLDDEPELRLEIRNKILAGRVPLAGRDFAQHEWESRLKRMGAESQAERSAASIVLTALDKARNGRVTAAGTDFKKASELAPGLPSVWAEWARFEHEQRNYELSHRLIERGLEIDPRDLTVLLVAAEVAKRDEDHDQAIEYLSRALEVDESNSVAMCQLGDVHKQGKNFEEAVRWLQAAIENANPESDRHLSVCYTSLADTKERWARECVRVGGWEQASQLLIEAQKSSYDALRATPDDVKAVEVERRVFLSMAKMSIAAADFERAALFAKKAQHEEPATRPLRDTTAESWLLLANVSLLNGEVGQARQYFEIGSRWINQGTWISRLFDGLRAEFEGRRKTGIVTRVIDRQKAIVSPTDGGETAFLHIGDLLQPIYTESGAYSIEGKVVSFIERTNHNGRPGATRVIVRSD